MNKKALVIIAFVLIISLYIANKINTARQLEYTIGLPQNVHVDGASLDFTLPLRVQNVTQTAINVKSLDFDVTSAGQLLGKAILNSAVTIVPAGFTVLPVSVSLSAFNLLTASKSIINLFKKGEVELGLNGLVYAEGFQIPVSLSFPFDYKSALS